MAANAKDHLQPQPAPRMITTQHAMTTHENNPVNCTQTTTTSHKLYTMTNPTVTLTQTMRSTHNTHHQWWGAPHHTQLWWWVLMLTHKWPQPPTNGQWHTSTPPVVISPISPPHSSPSSIFPFPSFLLKSLHSHSFSKQTQIDFFPLFDHCNFLMIFQCLSKHSWSDLLVQCFSDGLLMDWEQTNTHSPLEMTGKHQWKSNGQPAEVQWNSNRLLLLSLFNIKKPQCCWIEPLTSGALKIIYMGAQPIAPDKTWWHVNNTHPQGQWTMAMRRQPQPPWPKDDQPEDHKWQTTNGQGPNTSMCEWQMRTQHTWMAMIPPLPSLPNEWQTMNSHPRMTTRHQQC